MIVEQPNISRTGTDSQYSREIQRMADQLQRSINQSQAVLPIGAVLDLAIQPEKVVEPWLFCDGRDVGRAKYRKLFDAIGTTFGVGDGETTFNLPDYRGKIRMGVPSNTGANLFTGQSVSYELAEDTGATFVYAYVTPVIRCF